MKTFLMGIDIGTTGSKAMIIDTLGNVISSGYRESSVNFPKPNWVEQNGEMLIENTFAACKDAVINSGLDPSEIVAVGFSTQRATFGLIDSDNQLIDGIFYVWQDNRAATEIDYILSKMSASEMYNIAGHPITPTFGFEKIVWLMRNRPETYQKAKKIVFVPDYAMYKFGADDYYCEVTNAGCSGMLDIRNLTWSKEITELYGIEESKLLPLVKPGAIVGRISKEVSQKTGLAEGTILCSGSGDNQCGALGAGVVQPGDATLSLGTSGVLVAGVDEPKFVESMGLMVNPAASAGLYELEGIQLGAASSYKWIRDTIATLEKTLGQDVNIDPYNIMDFHIKNSPVGSNGVVFMPFLIGAGYPYWNSEARGLFAGLTFSTTKSDMIRSVMEGITLESKDMYENMKVAGVEINSLTVIGGAAKSANWKQIIADMFNVQIRCLAVTDSTIIGAAILAGVGAGLFKSAKDGAERIVKFTDTVEPIAENVETYNAMYDVYKNIYSALNSKSIFKQLSNLS